MVLGTGAAATQESSVERGRPVYDKWCTPCHGAGEGKPGTIAAAAIYKGSKAAVLTERTDLTSAGIKRAVRTGVYVMPRFRKTEITDAELDAIVAYLTRNAVTGK
ncbi:MAG: p-cresol methylhydroxylase [Blastocatellia bacterium]|nr:MAG: p-cresol methylhydroxylase [Blastocatellia bacterium]